jgi:two-component system sensor histidine kinase KdpD
MATGTLRLVRAVGVPLTTVAVVTAALRVADADLAVAALCFVPVVIGCALLGAAAGAVSVVAAFLATNFYFTSPRNSFAITKSQDLFALVVFVFAATAVSVTVAQVSRLRRRAEAQARAVESRLELTSRLAAGDSPGAVTQRVSRAVIDLFEVESCEATLGADGRLSVRTDPTPSRFAAEQRARFDDFVAGLSESFDRARLAREAQDARDEAQVEETRAQFLAAMTHNLRTPIASIAAAAAVLRDAGPLPECERVDMLDTIQGEADRLDRLVTKVLLLGRIRAGTVRPDARAVETEEVVQAAAARVRLLGRGRVRMVVGDDVPPVRVDHSLIEVAMVNVLENAIRHTDAPIDVVVTPAEPSAVRVAVVDRGPGIDAGIAETMFEPFVRGADVDDTVGAGIGLAITREFVEAHGGRCWIEETPGGGATVVMTLPAARG